MNHSDSNPPPLTTGPLQALHVVGGRASLLLNYRFLIYNLVVRDLKSRYRNSVLGFLWSLLNPLGMMAVFTVISLVLFRDQTIENYPIFLLSGILAWNYFSASMMTGTNSVVANGHLIKKVHFPTEVLPIATILANLVNFLLALLLLFAAIVILRIDFSPWIWLLPAVILIQTMFTLGIVFFFEHAAGLLPRYVDRDGCGHAGLVFFDPGFLFSQHAASFLYRCRVHRRYPASGLHPEPHRIAGQYVPGPALLGLSHGLGLFFADFFDKCCGVGRWLLVFCAAQRQF